MSGRVSGQDALAEHARPRAGAALTRSGPLGDQLSAHIGNLIESGEFEEGSRLPAENELAERFGVSRPIIREALSRLRSQGLIVSRRGSGSYVQRRAETRVAPPTETAFGPLSSLAQVKMCFQFRATIEGDAAFYAAQNRNEDSLVQMREALSRIEAAIASGMVGMHPDLEFHIAIARASGNDFFETVMRQMQTPIEFTINLARSLSLTRTVEHIMTIQAEHVAIYDAIAARDGDTARRVMRAHLDNACIRIFNGPSGAAA
jgi:DNA-binding FadR family transcriptional regulator